MRTSQLMTQATSSSFDLLFADFSLNRSLTLLQSLPTFGHPHFILCTGPRTRCFDRRPRASKAYSTGSSFDWYHLETGLTCHSQLW
jgi:hypothetical protein